MPTILPRDGAANRGKRRLPRSQGPEPAGDDGRRGDRRPAAVRRAAFLTAATGSPAAASNPAARPGAEVTLSAFRIGLRQESGKVVG